MITDGVIEIPGIIILILCLVRCVQYAIQNYIKQGRYFWLASILVFFAVIRRELNYVPELLFPRDFSLLSYSYDWWEDGILLVVYILIIGLLIYARRYLWAVLKVVPISLYIIVPVLAGLEYMGENAIILPEAFGVIVEELAETAIYGCALIYLWSFKLTNFEVYLSKKNDFEFQTH